MTIEIDLMTVKQVAEKLHCCTKTVRRLFRTGKLTGPAPFHLGPNAKIRIHAASVGALAGAKTVKDDFTDSRHDQLDGHCYEGCPCLVTEADAALAKAVQP